MYSFDFWKVTILNALKRKGNHTEIIQNQYSEYVFYIHVFSCSLTLPKDL